MGALPGKVEALVEALDLTGFGKSRAASTTAASPAAAAATPAPAASAAMPSRGAQENNELTASDRRILIGQWYVKAFKKACEGEAKRKYFEHTGGLLTADGSGDALLKLEGKPIGEVFGWDDTPVDVEEAELGAGEVEPPDMHCSVRWGRGRVKTRQLKTLSTTRTRATWTRRAARATRCSAGLQNRGQTAECRASRLQQGEGGAR